MKIRIREHSIADWVVTLAKLFAPVLLTTATLVVIFSVMLMIG